MASIPANAFAERLASLKKTGGPVHDASAPKTTGYMSEADVAVHQGKMLDLNIEEWLPLITEFTFETEYVPITAEQAQLLADTFEEWSDILATHRKNDGKEDEISSLKLSAATQAKIGQMGQDLQGCIERLGGIDNAVFVKTSSRSAKDAPIFGSKLRALMAKYLKGKQDSVNTRLLALLQAATDMLRMHSAQEVLEAFARSQRIHDDMLLALDRIERFRENFVVRRWHNIAVDQEYRAFVYQGKMTAISQYNHVVYSERVAKTGYDTMQLCVKFWEEHIRERLSPDKFLESYVIDFAVTGEQYGDEQAPQTGETRIWVIELNPYASSTDAALFSWQNELSLLQGKDQSDVAMRVVNSPAATSVKAIISVEWRDLLDISWERLLSYAEE